MKSSSELSDPGRVAVMIAGGGTAGHTNPGIAVAEALVAGGVEPAQITFVGSTRGNEAALVPAAGFHLDVLAGRGIPRRVSVAAVKSIGELLMGMGSALPLLRRRRPAVVLCLGGFAAFAPSVAALSLGIPVIVTEQNARASLVNRIIGLFARACAVPFPPTKLPRSVLCGNPTRRAVVEALEDGTAEGRAAARSHFGVHDDSTLFVGIWAGSLGSDRVNSAARALAEQWKDRADVAIHHVVGRRNPDALVPLNPDANLRYHTVPYADDMPLLLKAADVAVTRGGASTVAELSIARLPAVIVPLPNAPRDHQRANAGEVVEAGKGVIIDDSDLDGETLARALLPFFDPSERNRMRVAPPTVDHAQAADRVADLLRRYIEVEVHR